MVKLPIIGGRLSCALLLFSTGAVCRRNTAIHSSTLHADATEATLEADACSQNKDKDHCLGNCMWRQRGGCAEKKPENCRGMNKDTCRTHWDICHYEFTAGAWEDRCKGGAPSEGECQQWDAAEETCEAATGCMFRSSPANACVRENAQNCVGMNRNNCEKHLNVCLYDVSEQNWQDRCAARAAVSSSTSRTTIPATLPTSSTSKTSTTSSTSKTSTTSSTSNTSLSNASESAFAWKAIGTWAAQPYYIAGLIALVIFLWTSCWCCCRSHKATQPRAQVPISPPQLSNATGFSNVAHPSAPSNDGPLQVSVPNHVSPGQDFQFTHPVTGQLLRTTAPWDGSHTVVVHT